MEVLDCMSLEEDQYAFLNFLTFVGHADAADVEYIAIGMTADVESTFDTEEVLDW